MLDLTYSYNAQPDDKEAELCKALGITDLFGEDIPRFFTTCADVISKRHKIFRDLFSEEDLIGSLEKLDSLLCDLFDAFELSGIGINRSSNESALNTLCSINAYVSFIEGGYDALVGRSFSSEGLKSVFNYLKAVKDSAEFALLKKNASLVTEDIRGARSVTIGINLDANLRPMEVGLVSINQTPYRSNSLVQKLFSGSFNQPKDFECLCPISTIAGAASREEIAAVNSRLNSALNTILGKQFKKISRETKEYLTSVCAELTGLKEGLSFYIRTARFFANAKSSGLPICVPRVSYNEYRIDDLYNYRIAASKGAAGTVPNSIRFDEKGRVYVLTGENSGGKTVFIESVAFAQVLLQLGMPVHAKNAVMYPFDAINVYFASADEKNLYGRFENEARWFAERVNSPAKKPLFILDELFSVTNASEATGIALSALRKIRAASGCCIFSTHLHELSKAIADNQGDTDYSGFDTLYIRPEDGGEKYKVIRKAPSEYESRAVTIAKKYGII